MHAAFTLSKNSDLWVVACGMPFISVEVGDLMWKRKQELQCDAVVPCISGMLPHPLHGIYHESCNNMIIEFIGT